MLNAIPVLLLLVQTTPPPAPAAQAAPTTQPAATQPASAPSLLVGPLRLEITGMSESRVWVLNPQTGMPRSELLLQLRLVGERVPDVVRAGRVIFTEAVDDSGQALLRPDSYTEAERTETFRVRSNPDVLRERGLAMNTRLDATSRSAKSLRTLKGGLRVIMASTSEDVAIPNPRQWEGKVVEHPRLKELGIELKVLAAGNPSSVPHTLGTITLATSKNQEYVKGIEFFDAWMARMRASARNAQSNEGEPVVVYQLGDQQLTENSQMIIQVFPKIEDVRVPIELENVALP